MRFNVVSNLHNGGGLQHDCQLLTEELIRHGHTVTGLQFNDLKRVPMAEVNLFVETVVPEVFPHAPQQWVIPNPEWWLAPYHAALPKITRFFCKTEDSCRLFRAIAGDRVQYLGFMSRDLFQPETESERRFLHIAGNSTAKNTEAVLQAWKIIPYHLTLITQVPRFVHHGRKTPRVTVQTKVPHDTLALLLNTHLFHLCPSEYEGYGHYLHEAMGVGAIVLTTDAPPMNTFGTPPELLMPATTTSERRLAKVWTVSPQAIIDSVDRAVKLTPDEVQHWSAHVRRVFHTEREAFRLAFAEVLNTCQA